MVPDGWEQHPIGDFLTESRIPGSDGLTADKITVKLYGNGVYAKNEKRLGSASTKYYKRQVGQFIYSKLDFLNGAFGIIPEELNGYESTLDLPTFDLSPQIDAQWLLSYVAREIFYRAHIGLAKGGRKARRVSPSEFLSIEILFPPLSEQKKIAVILSSVDDAIQAIQTVIDQTRRVKQGLLQQILTCGIGHTQFKQTEIGEIPEDWDVVSISDIGEVVTGSTPSTKRSEYWGGDIPFVTPSDISDAPYVTKVQRTVTSLGASEGRIIPSGSVLITCIASIGKNALVNRECLTNQQINSIVCNDLCDPIFIYNSMEMMSNKLSQIAGITAVPIVNKSLFSKMQLALPTLKEQQNIASILSSNDEVIQVAKKSLNELRLIKKGLMQDLLTGRVRVKLDGDATT